MCLPHSIWWHCSACTNKKLNASGWPTCLEMAMGQPMHWKLDYITDTRSQQLLGTKQVTALHSNMQQTGSTQHTNHLRSIPVCCKQCFCYTVTYQLLLSKTQCMNQRRPAGGSAVMFWAKTTVAKCLLSGGAAKRSPAAPVASCIMQVTMTDRSECCPSSSELGLCV
jgi:hypothetical protein